MSNSINIVGNLVKDPELKSHSSGEFLAFTLAQNTKITGEDHTNYWDTIYFSNGAKSLAGIMKKGMRITVLNGVVNVIKAESNGKQYTNVNVKAGDVILPPKDTSSGDQASGNSGLNDEIPF